MLTREGEKCCFREESWVKFWLATLWTLHAADIL